MIQSIHLKNFQSHKDTFLKLSLGINIISGKSDHGKSSIIRALHWCINNRPNGFAFKSHFATPKECTEITLVTTEGVSITRKKSKSENCYITIQKGEILEYKALQTHVPEEIQQLLHLGEYNLQTQFEPFFLLQSVSPGEIAKKLNEVCGLSIIDSSLKNIDVFLRESKETLKYIEQEQVSLDSKLETYSTIDKQKKIVDRLQKQEQQKNKCSKKQKQLTHLIMHCERTQTQRLSIQKWLSIIPFQKDLLIQIEAYHKQKTKKANLRKHKEKLRYLTTQITTQKNWLSLEPFYKKLHPLCVQFPLLKKERISLQKLIQRSKRIHKKITAELRFLEGEERIKIIHRKIQGYRKAKEERYEIHSKIKALTEGLEKEHTKQKQIKRKQKEYGILQKQLGLCSRCPIITQESTK